MLLDRKTFFLFFGHPLNLNYLIATNNFQFLSLVNSNVFALLSQGNVLVVTEVIHGGSLENLLRAPGERNNYHNVCCKLNDRQLVTVAFQIAMGMQHLEERKVRPTGSV